MNQSVSYSGCVDAQTILTGERWRALAEFVKHWYAEPLGTSLLPEQDLVAAEHRLGRRLPGALREWFLLVGHRFCDVNQDSAVWLDQLSIRSERLPIWWENQGNWSFDVELDSSDDEPWASVDSDEPSWTRRARLPKVLLGMVYSDTLVGAWSGIGVGPLGKLAPKVVGGLCDDAPPEADDRIAALPKLDVVTNPYFDEPLRGHDTLVFRTHCSGMWDWMAVGQEATEQAVALLGVQDEQRPRRLALAFRDVPESDRGHIKKLIESPADALEGVSRFRSRQFRSDYSSAVLELETSDPEKALSKLLESLPEGARATLRAGHRSEHITRFVPCWPLDATEFVLPR